MPRLREKHLGHTSAVLVKVLGIDKVDLTDISGLVAWQLDAEITDPQEYHKLCFWHNV